MGSLASDSDSVYATNSVPTNQWTSVAMVFDGTQSASSRTRLFINGVLAGVTYQNASAIPTQIASLATDTLIGARAGQGGGLSGAEFASGSLDDIRIYNRALSSNEVAQLYAIESGPRVDLVKAVKPSFSYRWVGTNYQLQLSADMNTWTNHGSPFTATNTSMVYPEYWDVDNWGKLFFRLQSVP